LPAHPRNSGAAVIGMLAGGLADRRLRARRKIRACTASPTGRVEAVARHLGLLHGNSWTVVRVHPYTVETISGDDGAARDAHLERVVNALEAVVHDARVLQTHLRVRIDSALAVPADRAAANIERSGNITFHRKPGSRIVVQKTVADRDADPSHSYIS